jgi:LacI family transcriptional regulator
MPIKDSNNEKPIIKKQPTSEDVAKLAGVSRATVSAYINETRYVSDKLKGQIDRAVDILNYTPNELARSLKMQSNKTIGLLIPVLSKFYLPMIRSINERIHERGYTMILGSSEENVDREKEILQVFTSKKVTGILMVPCGNQNARYIGQLQDRGINLVQLNRKVDQLDSDSVVSNTTEAIYDAIKYMVEQKKKKSIALMGYNPKVIADLDKKTGYLNAVKNYNLDTLIVETIDHDNAYNEKAFSAFVKNNMIDGVVCTTRTHMEVAFDCLKKMNKKIPDEVSLVGYDDPVWTTFVEPKITVISEERFKMGDTAVSMLFDRIEGKYHGKSKHIVMSSELIIRQS